MAGRIGPHNVSSTPGGKSGSRGTTPTPLLNSFEGEVQRVTSEGQLLDSVIALPSQWRGGGTISFDGVNFVVANYDRNRVVAGRITPTREVLDTVAREIAEFDPDTHFFWELGISSPTTAQGQTALRVETREVDPYMTHRAGCVTFPRLVTAIGKSKPRPDAQASCPTVVRSVLHVPVPLAGEGSPCEACLFDAMGRRVTDLKPGPNDVRHLGPGVYFVREVDSWSQGAVGSRVGKVLVLR